MPLGPANRVPAAGSRPADKAVEPEGVASRSTTTVSTPASFAVSAAHRPAAPAPMMRSGTFVPESSPPAATTELMADMLLVLLSSCWTWRLFRLCSIMDAELGATRATKLHHPRRFEIPDRVDAFSRLDRA